MASTSSFHCLQARCSSSSSAVRVSSREGMSTGSLKQQQNFLVQSGATPQIHFLGNTRTCYEVCLCSLRCSTQAAFRDLCGQTYVRGRGGLPPGVLLKSPAASRNLFAVRDGVPVRKANGIRVRCRQCGDSEKEKTAGKTCVACGYSKALVDFQETAASADGRHNMCRACLAAFRARWKGRELHHLELTPAAAWEQAKRCSKCALCKEVRDFPRGRWKDGLDAACRACLSNKAKSLPPRATAEASVCIKCGQMKPADEFRLSRSKVNGLSSHCKICVGELRSETVARLVEVGKYVSVEEKRCSQCRKTKEAAAFSRRKAASDGLQNMCKECGRAFMMRRRTRAKVVSEKASSGSIRQL